MRTILRLIISLGALGALAACAAPSPAPTLPPVVQTVLVPQTVIVTTAPETPTAGAPVARAPRLAQTRAAETRAAESSLANAPSPTPAPTDQPTLLRDKIKHIIVIMQENRSFDTYFGTYPGADGIPMQNGVPTVCSPDPQTKQCIKPYHNPEDVNSGGPHAAASATADIDGGKMDGFVGQFRVASKGCKGRDPNTPGCVEGKTPDVMG